MNSQFITIIPEIILLFFTLFCQIIILFKENLKKLMIIIGLLLFVAMFFYIDNYWNIYSIASFNNMFFNKFHLFKLMIFLFSLITIIIYWQYCNDFNNDFKYEFVTLILLSCIGSMIAISSFNLLLLFCAIELQNIPSYAIAGFDIKNPKCATASIKYFILNNIMTCFGLFGISFIYGFAGSLDFKEIADVCKSNINIGLTFGFILFLTNILFKLSAAPLHFWTPDIYEDIPIYSLNYFSSTLKISNILILVNLITEILWEYTAISINMLKYIAILSMLVGAFGGLYQTSLKKILAFSTILNIGYILMGISIHTNAAINASLNYAIIYSISLVAFIICLILLKLPQNFDDLKSISKISICLTLIIFSIIGLPPFLGFFVKYNLFYQVINEREFLLITVSIISTIISSIYYLRIISNLFFKKDNNIILQKNNAPILSILLIIFIIILSFGALYIRF